MKATKSIWGSDIPVNTSNLELEGYAYLDYAYILTKNVNLKIHVPLRIKRSCMVM